ncbi:MAG TPA: hypothetical protein VFK05_11565 [Polyangiaceae bacterium]|nr:hypothetical protein [Polyangiaceae bacterium]
MKSITAFRSASVLLFIFCLMHTGGGMLAQKSLGPAADIVFDGMKSVHFDFNGADCTWYGFWFGFGLTASIFLLLSSIVAWQFERVPSELWPHLQIIAWAFVLSHVANTVLAWKYFFAGPGVFGIVISLLLAFGTWRKSRVVSEHRLASP